MGAFAYFDVVFGTSGDMLLASFLDLGLPEELLTSAIKSLPIQQPILKISRVLKNGIRALKLDIICQEEHNHRSFKAIKDMIQGSSLKDDVKKLSVKIFEVLADAEAKVHGKSRDDVTFHEIGAVDSIVDIVGIATAISHFGITKAYHSVIPLCSGVTNCAHGKISAMSPAAALLLTGRKFYFSDIQDELITPTAAAVLNLIATPTQDSANFSCDAIGVGAGSKEFSGQPNIMRTFLDVGAGLTPALSPMATTVIEANIDDMNPQLFDFLLDSLLGCKGVLDAFIAPIIMKKSRPGFLLKVLLDKKCLKNVADIIFKNSSTIGLRHFDVNRITLERQMERIATKYGEFSVKVSKLEGTIVNASCEYDECKAAAKKLNLSVKEIMNNVNADIQRNYFNER